ncbi:hypothetical protein AV530_019340 [Patagioenas fasciata monilis]|uniref:Uncharacterized protein n=1 Tax=Patagioenas fasciata monilis TaxID=372326 RepID=A0A1V4JDD5_PATFA|nr:hypothetical protein AV530_019340 [Patagioenas fasciata monilis]
MMEYVTQIGAVELEERCKVPDSSRHAWTKTEREEDGERLRSRSPNQQPQHLRESCLLASVPGQPWSSGEELASVAVTQGEKARKHLSKGLLVTLELCWEWQAWSPPHGVAGPQDGCSPSHPIRAGSFGESRHRQGT